MQTYSLQTTPIKFITLPELQKFAELLKGLHGNSINIQDQTDGENITFSPNEGESFKLEINEKHLTLVVSSDGGLKQCDEPTPTTENTPLECSDLLQDIFNYSFFKHHPDMEIMITTHVLHGEKTYQTIKLVDYHSKAEYEKRLASTMKAMQYSKNVIKTSTESFNKSKAKKQSILVVLERIGQDEAIK